MCIQYIVYSVYIYTVCSIYRYIVYRYVYIQVLGICTVYTKQAIRRSTTTKYSPLNWLVCLLLCFLSGLYVLSSFQNCCFSPFINGIYRSLHLPVYQSVQSVASLLLVTSFYRQFRFAHYLFSQSTNHSFLSLRSIQSFYHLPVESSVASLPPFLLFYFYLSFSLRSKDYHLLPSKSPLLHHQHLISLNSAE